MPRSLPRVRSRAVATVALLATALIASTAVGPQAFADLPPVQQSTTVWTADGTTASTSGEHNGFSAKPMYAAGASGAAHDQSFDFTWDNNWAPITMDNDVVQLDRAPFAVSFQMRTDRSDLRMSLLGARNICSNDGIGWFDVRMTDQRIGFEVGGDRYAAVTSPVLVANGQWYTVDLRRDDTGISVTVDGQTARVNTSPSAVNPTAPFGVNNSPCKSRDGTGPFLGQIDDIRVGPLDITAPILTSLTDQRLPATGPAGAEVTYTVAATDDVDGAVTPTCTLASGSIFAVGATSVTCIATDATGNTATGSFTVTVDGAIAQATALVTTLQDWGSGCAVQASQAQTSLERGKLTAARGQLGATDNCTSAAAKAGRLTTAQSDAVREAIARIVATLG